MTIHVLPDYVINQLKAGEIVDRPVSVLKELIENSLDAQASIITIHILDGGKRLIQVDDDGTGIPHTDIPMSLERYATSKINEYKDMETLSSYGFRGEALASIASVAHVTIRSKTKNAITATKLTHRDQITNIQTIPVPFSTGTSVMVEDLFYHTPARRKYLKSAQTEYFYCYQLFLQFALLQQHIHRKLIKNNKTIFDLSPAGSFVDRIHDLYKKDWSGHLLPIDHHDEGIQIQGVLGDPTIRFAKPDHVLLFVNHRPVKDKILKKAVLQAYNRQLVYGEYPLAILHIILDPVLVDVNVHPRKTQVTFIDPGGMFSRVHGVVKKTLAGQKITSRSIPYGKNKRDAFPRYGKFAGRKGASRYEKSPYASVDTHRKPTTLLQDAAGSSSSTQLISHTSTPYITTPQELIPRDTSEQSQNHYTVLGQLWDSYIVLSSRDGVYYIDQHALAERIAFEKMCKALKNGDTKTSSLLHTLTISIVNVVEIDEVIKQLRAIGFDIDRLTENSVAVYGVPEILSRYQVDIEKLLDKIIPMDEISLDHMTDMIFAMKACKASITANQKLSYPQMEQLVHDGFAYIDGMFVCQHGRPFFIKIDKKEIEKMFDR